jgi:hypothetical protein
MRIELRTYGFLKQIDFLKQKVKGRKDVIRRAVRAAGKIYLAEMRAMVQRNKRSGVIAKSIGLKSRYYKKGDVFVAIIGVKSNIAGAWKGRRVISHKYAHLLDRGRSGMTQNIVFAPGKAFPIFRNKRIDRFARAGKEVKQKRVIPPFAGIRFTKLSAARAQGRALAAARQIVAQWAEGASSDG